MAPMVATAIRKFSSNTCLLQIPFHAFFRISYPITRYGTINNTNCSQPSTGSRDSTTISAAATMIRISIFFCFLFIIFPPISQRTHASCRTAGFSFHRCVCTSPVRSVRFLSDKPRAFSIRIHTERTGPGQSILIQNSQTDRFSLFSEFCTSIFIFQHLPKQRRSNRRCRSVLYVLRLKCYFYR